MVQNDLVQRKVSYQGITLQSITELLALDNGLRHSDLAKSRITKGQDIVKCLHVI